MILRRFWLGRDLIILRKIPPESSGDDFQQALTNPLQIESHQCYFIRLKNPKDILTDEQKQKLMSVLRGEIIYASFKDLKDKNARFLQGLILPRKSMITGWSDKATDILHLSELNFVERVEKGIQHTLAEIEQAAAERQKVMEPIQKSHEETVAELQKHFEAYVHEACDPMLQEILPDIHLAHKHLFPDVAADVAHQTQFLRADEITGMGAQDIHHLLSCKPSPSDLVSDVELAMFTEVNSEHCRHHIFRSSWSWELSDHKSRASESLMTWIKRTTSPGAVLSAYKDNSAVLKGHKIPWLRHGGDGGDHKGEYRWIPERAEIVLKVETHNHPTAVCPYPGAATGVGGEIRDEVATGRGATTMAGACGYIVSHLCLEELDEITPWENSHKELTSSWRSIFASASKIMTKAPLGAARYGNEYGRPLITGFFRTLFYQDTDGTDLTGPRYRGFHKPLMICGGMGSVRESQVKKNALSPGDLIVVLGGAAMKIGLGGGSLSSGGNSASHELSALFASVQRENPEMQRRAFQMIQGCYELNNNPIISIHDVGAGGLANAVPELVNDAGLGARIELRDIPIADSSMNPKEIWCNESQERYVLAIHPDDLSILSSLAAKERAPIAVIGSATQSQHLKVFDRSTCRYVVDVDLTRLFSPADGEIVVTEPFIKSPVVEESADPHRCMHLADILKDPTNIPEFVSRVLAMPCVSDKSFLVTIADRSVGGLTVLEPMTGPWQVPVADAGVTLSSYESHRGRVISMGERPQAALMNPAAASRIAAAEAIMNALCADVSSLSDISMSANWQVDFSHRPDRSGLWEAVSALSEWCQALGIPVPVGKDSMSMRADLTHKSSQQKSSASTQTSHIDSNKAMVISPVTLVITAVAPVDDVRKTLTPCLQWRPSYLVWVDLGGPDASPSLGCSTLAMAYSALWDQPNDIRPETVSQFFDVFYRYKNQGAIHAYHDISDGGMFVAAVEMAFASQRSLNLTLDQVPYPIVNSLFAESVGALLQVDSDHYQEFLDSCRSANLAAFPIAQLPENDQSKQKIQTGKLSSRIPEIQILKNGQLHYRQSLAQLRKKWSGLSYQMKKRRDNPQTAADELEYQLNPGKGLHFQDNHVHLKAPELTEKPMMAILREQGVNGHQEMAYAFLDAGFQVYDLHMSECLDGSKDINQFVGFAAAGGFSYGDVLGAGRGWAQVIRDNSKLRESFKRFFSRQNTFTLGVCNGCQMLSHLRHWIPGGECWPTFEPNVSQQFESRTVMVEVGPSPSVMWKSMEGMKLPVVVAHGEGNAQYSKSLMESKTTQQLIGVRYLDGDGMPTEKYPHNPNGSMMATAGVTSLDGRVNLMMPHPERGYLSVTHSFQPSSWGKHSPWKKMFLSARLWVDKCYR